MGLDMYLERRIYTKNWEHTEKKARFDVTVKRGEEAYPHIDKSRITMVIEEVGYWRKANAIHRWFVENIQDGKDNCADYDVSTNQLKALLGLCIQIRENPSLAPELLPTQSGFFFGGTNYDTDYTDEINTTIDIIENCLKMNDEDSWFVYRSSW